MRSDDEGRITNIIYRYKLFIFASIPIFFNRVKLKDNPITNILTREASVEAPIKINNNDKV